MTNSQEAPRIIETALGPVLVLVQSGEIAYVRAGSGDVGDPTGPLELARGVQLAGRAHFKLGPGGWGVHGSGVRGFTRTDTNREPTDAMLRTAREAIAVALGQSISADELGDAQRVKVLGQAADLRERARGMAATVDALNRQASELESDPDGARIVHMHNRLFSGATERVDYVRTRAGEMLAVPEPPDVYGAQRYPGSIREQTERD